MLVDNGIKRRYNDGNIQIISRNCDVVKGRRKRKMLKTTTMNRIANVVVECWKQSNASKLMLLTSPVAIYGILSYSLSSFDLLVFVWYFVILTRELNAASERLDGVVENESNN